MATVELETVIAETVLKATLGSSPSKLVGMGSAIAFMSLNC